LDKLSLKTPVISSLVVSIELEKFFRALSMLLKRNIALPYAVEASAATVDNSILRDKLRRLRRDILSGTSLSFALKREDLVREDITAIINTGQESGGLHRLLLRIADRQAYGNEMIVKRLLLMLEPAVIFAVGLIIGYIVIAMLLPVFQISSIIR
jgi:type II secretory pathway component PulF